MASSEKALRSRALQALHAEGKKRGFDHEALRNEVFRVRSLADVPIDKLLAALKNWTGRGLRRVRAEKRGTELPRKGYGTDPASAEMVSGDDLNTLAEAFAQRGLDKDAQHNFIRRQLGGREVIRTRKDFHRVFSGIRAMNRRDGI